MTTENLLDGRLRPCYEYHASVTSALSAMAITQMPFLAGLPVSTSYALAVAIGCMSASQVYNGSQLRKYQKGLLTLEPYFISTDEIPVSDKDFWLGKGFEVTQVHAQRMYECNKPAGLPYIMQSDYYKSARRFTRNNHKSNSWAVKKIVSALNQQYFINVGTAKFLKNPLAPLPPVGGEPYLHGVGVEKEEDILVNLSSLQGHVLCMGTTGCGKTRAAELFLSSDIARRTKRPIRYRNSNGGISTKMTDQADGAVICFDPKGDAELLARMYSEAKRNNREFYFFHLGETDITARYNGIGNFSRISECATRIAGQLSGSGDSAAFKEFAWRFISIISRALFNMGIRPTYDHVRTYIMDMEQLFIKYAEFMLVKFGIPHWRELLEDEMGAIKSVPQHLKGMSRKTIALNQLIQELTKQSSSKLDSAYEGLLNAVRYDASYFSKITASLLPLLEKLCSGDNLSILSPDYADTKDSRPILDWTQVIRKRAVVYCGFAAMVDRDVASAVSNSMLSDLLSLSGKIYQSGINYGIDGSSSKEAPNIYLHLDEANETCGDEFIPILNKARGSGVRVIAYTQARQDMEVRLGDKAKAQVVESNFNTLIMFRVKTEDTAKLLTDQLKEINIYDSTISSAITPDSIDDIENGQLMSARTSDSVAVSKTQKLLRPDDIISLPKGQAYALLEGSKLYKLRFPLPKENKHTLPAELSEIHSKMKKQYQSFDQWWDKSA